MTDISIVEDHFKFPFKLHNFQVDTIKEAITKDNVLFRSKVGLGKTAMSLYLGLYHSLVSDVEQILVLAPPALLDQWADFVAQVNGIDGCMIYRGTPAERKNMDLKAEPVVLMSYNIFRMDNVKVELWARKRKLFVIGDELSLKSSSQTYKKFKQLVWRKMRIDPYVDKPKHKFCALNATPVSDREQVYWWCAVFDPSLYCSLRAFRASHVAREDHWGKALDWYDVDKMDANFGKISVLTDDSGLEMPEQVFTEIPYKLESKHLKLYKALTEAEFDKLPEEAPAMMVEAMFSVLQRAVLCPQEFGLDIKPPIFDIINQYIDQTDQDDKILIYTRHVVVSQMLGKQYPQAVTYYGKVSNTNKKENLGRFKTGDAEIMIANLDSLSKGQNLQIANHTIFTEFPFRSDAMTQACGRTARQGQTKTCFFALPVAKGTIQVQIMNNLMKNDVDLISYNRNKKTLREFLEE